MTVVNMLSMGDEGVAIADEQSSGANRKYNVAQKLHPINESVVFGGSGPADFIQEVYNLTVERIEESKKRNIAVNSRNIYETTLSILLEAKNRRKSEILFANYGLNMDEINTGLSAKMGKPLDSDLKNNATNLLRQVDESFSTSILLGGFENDKFKIYSLDANRGGIVISRPYCSIGSGSDEADKVLSRYVVGLPRSKRENIDKPDGLVKAIEATNAASQTNIGVGGTPSIFYAREGKETSVPGESECILATELVHGMTRGFLDLDYTKDTVYKLVLGNNKFEEIEEEMKTKANDWKAFDRSLRGYK